MQTENRWESRGPPRPIAARGADDRFKLLRKKRAVCANRTAHHITFHKLSLFWGFLRTGSFQTSRLITAEQWGPGLPGCSGVTPEHSAEVSPSQKVRGAQALNTSLQKGGEIQTPGGGRDTGQVCVNAGLGVRAAGTSTARGSHGTLTEHLGMSRETAWFPGAPDTVREKSRPCCGAAAV